MKKQSAGLLIYHAKNKQIEVLLVHPGGPFWAKKDEGAWSIPKGEFAEGEEALTAACREFTEELGIAAPEGEMLELQPVKQPSGKVIYAWAIMANIDTTQCKSNTFELEWPPKSGQTRQFPEVDQTRWFTLPIAKTKLIKGQIPILEQLAIALGEDFAEKLPGDEQGSENRAQTSLF